MSEDIAVTIPVAVETAADLIFNVLGFRHLAAGLDGYDASDVPILIWGGASAVGVAAIQVAKAAGFEPIFTTASPKNHERLLKIGSTKVFDYNSPTVVEDIRNAVSQSGKKLTVAIDTVCNGTTLMGQPLEVNNTPDLAKACISDNVSGEDVRLASTLQVPHDSDWIMGFALRPSGKFSWLGTPQDPSCPVRIAKYMDWFITNHEEVWQHILSTSIVEGADKVIEEIKRVAMGGTSMEKVIIARPL
jgi:threonine dehydrogenase-like Zn-dependent dehydrogenase